MWVNPSPLDINSQRAILYVFLFRACWAETLISAETSILVQNVFPHVDVLVTVPLPKAVALQLSSALAFICDPHQLHGKVRRFN